MGVLRSRTEKQVYEFTVYTFNQLLGYLQSKDRLSREDYEELGRRLLRLYQVWNVLWGRRRQRADRIATWKAAADWVQNSGVLDHVVPLIHAEEDEQSEVLWNLVTSDEFLRWSLRQLARRA